MAQEILDFIVPHDELLQLLFFGVMSALLLATIAGVSLGAKPRHWAANWQGRGGEAVGNSVHELSDVVASRAEKLADIMPGILLILGLLGTFLGLGIALNKASLILQQASSAGSTSMDGTMGNLLGMMQGLGTKFKTSTWGILAFLLLKGWAASNGYEERRLRWCVVQQKTLQSEARAQRQEAEALVHERLIRAVEQVGERLAAGLQEQQQQSHTLFARAEALHAAQEEAHGTRHDMQVQTQTLLRETVEGMSERIAVALQRNETRRDTLFAQHDAQLQQQHAIVLKAMQLASRENVAALASIARLQEQQGTAVAAMSSEMSQTRESIQSFVQANTDNLDTLMRASETMSGAGERVAEGADELRQVVAAFENQVVTVLGKLNEDLSASIEQMNDGFNGNLKAMAERMTATTNLLSESIEALRRGVNETMGSVQETLVKSGKQQTDAAVQLSSLTMQLERSVQAMVNTVENLTDPITTGLETVADNNRRVGKLGDKLIASCENIMKTCEQLAYKSASDGESLSVAAGHLSNVATQLTSNAADKRIGEAYRTLDEIASTLREIAGRTHAEPAPVPARPGIPALTR